MEYYGTVDKLKKLDGPDHLAELIEGMDKEGV